MDLNSFGHALRLRRQEQDKTLAEVGRAAGCTRQNVHKVERALSNPTVQTLQRIAQALDLRVELSLVDQATPEWNALAPDLLQRVRLESQLHRIARLTPAADLEELERALADLESRLVPASAAEEHARACVLADLLKDAGIDEDVAVQVATSEPDKPTSWESHPDRFAKIYDEARRRMAS